MSELTWSKQVAELSGRAAQLSERGAHYFVGGIIGAGLLRPELLAEFEKILHRIETDPQLLYCWREFQTAASTAPDPSAQHDLTFSFDTPVAAIAGRAVVTAQAAAAEATAEPVNSETDEAHARSGVVQFVPEPASAPAGSQGFFSKLFRRQRAAA
ncbi:MAG: hypothetical protein ABIP20_16970 [Chthoniobacteraceae bacterium]